MNGPSPAYLANLAALLDAGAAQQGLTPVNGPIVPPSAQPVTINLGAPPAAPPPMLPTPAPAPAQAGPAASIPPPAGPNMSPAPFGPPAPPPAPPGMSLPTDDPAHLMSRPPPNMSPGPASGPMGVEAGPTPAPEQSPGYQRGEFPLTQVSGGGVIPAHEVETRGPSLLAAQGAANKATEGAIDSVTGRSMGAAEIEFRRALLQERDARTREAAWQQSLAEREEEMAQRQADFDATVSELGKQGQLDRDRFWASRSTPQKVAGFIELALSGFTGAPSMIMKRIDDDVKAQEFAYQATRDTANAKQTAFGLAMQKYQNADAARSMARAAALDVQMAQLAQVSAMNRGTEIGNRADMAYAELSKEKMGQIAAGVRFLPAAASGRMYVDPRTGITYSEAQAREFAKELRGYEQKREEIGLNTAGDLLKESAKSGAKASEEAKNISHQLQSAGVPQARAAADRALAALNVSPGGAGEAVARWGLGDTLSRAVLSEDSNAREQAYNEFMSQAMKATYGNVTASEEVRSAKSYGSTGNPEARRRSIVSVLNTLNEVERNALAGATPAGQQQYRQNKESAQAPNEDWKKSLKLHGGK